ncbi:MAG TPA: helix-turn-helix domain-containing protein [Thermoanaerobaculia bacterium]|nr:helix-turn-helix domain-containing protein [Thermoanaerobaculia bacterium]
MSEPKRGRGRPRRAGADEKILAVTLELLRASGYRDFNVDEVSARTGIAKTTIYRRWPTKDALVGAAVEPILQATSLRVDSIDALRESLAPQRDALVELVGEERADELLGALLVKMLTA